MLENLFDIFYINKKISWKFFIEEDIKIELEFQSKSNVSESTKQYKSKYSIT